VTLGAPVDYDLFVPARIVRSPRPALAADDVPLAWFESHIGIDPEPGRTLWSYRPSIYDQLNSGDTQALLSIPTVRDGRDEGRESVTLRIRVNKTTVERTVFVR
jgi:hypothetical protein